MNSTRISLAVIAFAFILFSPHLSEAQITAIRAGKLLNPANGTIATNQVILIENKKIKSVGPGIQIPAGANLIDLSASTVLPGFFDAHSHLCQSTTPENRDLFTTELRQPTAYRAIIGVASARAMLESGFTTVRDVGNNGNYADTSLRRAIENGLVQGPTIINAGRIIGPFGGQYHLHPERRELGHPEYLFADTRDEMTKAIRENVHFGALVIKIVVDDQKYIYSAEDIRFMVEEAARAGLKVAAHCMTEQGARNAILGGVASVEHGFRMSDEALRLAKTHNVVLVGTDFTQKAAEALGLPPPVAKQFHEIFLERLKRAHRIGVTMAFGSDTFAEMPGETRGTMAISFIDTFVEAGVPAPEILRILITNSANLLGVEKERGTIAPGMFADIVATPDNPLQNIQTLKRLSFVMKDGEVIRHSR